MRTLGVIVARANSKRLPCKVLLPLGGVPLLAWSVRAALNSGLDRIILSTEDEKVASIGRYYGVDTPFLRPARLALDDTRNDAVLQHAMEVLDAAGEAPFDAIVLLQSTGPFVHPDDIAGCVDALREYPHCNCAFAARTVREQPAWMFTQDGDGRADLLLAGSLAGVRQLTQSNKRCFLPAGTTWAVRRTALKAENSIYVPPYKLIKVPQERAVDIDEEFDLIMAEAVRDHYGFRLFNAPLAR
jgi:CMP-N-acetylneuraminic acid synthetase